MARVTAQGRPICFQIGGRYEPDSALIDRGRDILGSFDRFSAEVAAFLAAQAARDALAPFAVEIRALAIQDICLFWPRRPDDGRFRRSEIGGRIRTFSREASPGFMLQTANR